MIAIINIWRTKDLENCAKSFWTVLDDQYLPHKGERLTFHNLVTEDGSPSEFNHWVLDVGEINRHVLLNEDRDELKGETFLEIEAYPYMDYGFPDNSPTDTSLLIDSPEISIHGIQIREGLKNQ